MHFPDLNLPITLAQAFNAASWIATLIWVRVCMPNAKSRENATREAGPTKFMPPGDQGKTVSFVASLGVFIPMLVFLISMPVALFHTPWWLAWGGLPVAVGREVYVGLRVVGCVWTLVDAMIGKAVFKHLGAQLGMIGVRERPKVVKTGPFSVVRHPGYGAVLGQQLAWILAFWNWIFGPAFIVSAIAFGIKMPIEERVMEDHKDIGDAYKLYKKEVPYRVVPFLW